MTINFDKIPKYIRREIDPPKVTVEAGSRGRRTKQIQEWLNFHQCRTGIDSDYGPATIDCVKDFQRKKNLPASGKVNTKTWSALVKPMRDALVAPEGIDAMSASEAVLAVSNQHVDQHPIEIGSSNSGPWVRLYCEGHDGPAMAWCAGFVSLIMHQAYFYRAKKAPITGSVSCDSLAAQAKTAGLFIQASDITSARVDWVSLGKSCVFLRRRTLTDWTHAGFAFQAKGSPGEFVFSTIEGNTNDEGSREGFEACRRKRSIARSNYDFIKFE